MNLNNNSSYRTAERYLSKHIWEKTIKLAPFVNNQTQNKWIKENTKILNKDKEKLTS